VARSAAGQFSSRPDSSIGPTGPLTPGAQLDGFVLAWSRSVWSPGPFC